MLVVGLVGGALLLAGGDLFGHGGSYRGPGDRVPPNTGPGPGTGGPNTGGPATPGGTGPGTPVPGSGGPATPAGGGFGGGAGGGRGPITGPGTRGKKHRGDGYEQWEFWWEYNKDRYLDLRARLGDHQVETGTSGFLTGAGTRISLSPARRPTLDDVERRVVPVLRSLLGESSDEIVDSAVLALGRSVRAEAAQLVLADVEAALASAGSTVRQSAVLALGVLGSQRSIPLLLAILRDAPEGRRALGQNNAIQGLPRAFAAIALGLIGSVETIDPLMETVRSSASGEVDLRSSALLALGLFETDRQRIVRFLVEQLGNRRLDRTSRAQIPISLGRLGEEALPALPELLRAQRSRKSDIRLAESCTIALGQLASLDDAEVLDALYRTIEDGKQAQQRHFGFIALARIGARAAAAQRPDPSASGVQPLDRLSRFLLRQLVKPDRKTHLPWAALSLAILGRAVPQEDPFRVAVTEKIGESFEGSNNPSYKSAMAISLGLLQARSAGELLDRTLQRSNDPALKGYLALALGMMRRIESSGRMRELLLDGRDARMRIAVATGLGLMGDAEVADLLIEALGRSSSLTETASMAQALGLIGDRAALDRLFLMANDDKATESARGFACVAIGLISEKTDLPWNEVLSANTNYRTVLPSLYELVDIL